MAILTELADIRRVLLEYRRIAVLGAHPNEYKAAYYVPKYLASAGYEIYPVNPVYTGQMLFGKEIIPKLSGLQQAVDIVNIFRRSDALDSHLPEILALQPRPKLAWFQLGISNDEVAKALSEAGIEVIQNRCMLADHQRVL